MNESDSTDSTEEQLGNHIETIEPDERLQEYHEDESVTVLYGYNFWQAITDDGKIDSGRFDR